MTDALERYTPAQRQVIEAYWETIRFTRSTGKVSDGVKQREYEYWTKFEPEIVIEALGIHIEGYPTHREDYTRGIMRNRKRMKGGATHTKPERSHAVAAQTGKSGQGQGQKRDANAEEAFRRHLAGL